MDICGIYPRLTLLLKLLFKMWLKLLQSCSPCLTPPDVEQNRMNLEVKNLTAQLPSHQHLLCEVCVDLCPCPAGRTCWHHCNTGQCHQQGCHCLWLLSLMLFDFQLISSALCKRMLHFPALTKELLQPSGPRCEFIPSNTLQLVPFHIVLQLQITLFHLSLLSVFKDSLPWNFRWNRNNDAERC